MFKLNTKLTTARLTQLLAVILMTLMTNGCQNLLVAEKDFDIDKETERGQVLI